MSDGSPSAPVKRLPPILAGRTPDQAGEPKFLGDRCGDGMYHLRGVWRCPRCGIKTDCCGW